MGKRQNLILKKLQNSHFATSEFHSRCKNVWHDPGALFWKYKVSCCAQKLWGNLIRFEGDIILFYCNEKLLVKEGRIWMTYYSSRFLTPVGVGWLWKFCQFLTFLLKKCGKKWKSFLLAPSYTFCVSFPILFYVAIWKTTRVPYFYCKRQFQVWKK